MIKGAKVMKIRKITKNSELDEAQNLIWQTFLKYEAPDYSEEGIQTFKEFIFDKNNLINLDFFGAFTEKNLIGVIASRNKLSHITCFFVEEKHQNKGIGKKLWLYLLDQSSSSKFTVNSSPYAVPIYHRLGFTDTENEKMLDGITFTPMKFVR